MTSSHIVLVSGSLRPGATTERIARWCAERCVDAGATARVFPGAEVAFPAYEPGAGRTLPAAREFLEQLRRADGVVLVSPTYHGSLSGLLKNALDYVNDIEGPSPYLEGRAIGSVAVGAAAEGAVAALTALRGIAHALRGWPVPRGVTLSRMPALSASEDGSPEEERLAEMVGQVLWLAAARAPRSDPSRAVAV